MGIVDSLLQVDNTLPVYVAMVLVAVGENDRALDLLESRAGTLQATSVRAPEFDVLREHPRFRALLERHER